MDRPQVAKTRYQALDVWRGIVCLVVVLEHAGVALWSGAGDASNFEGFVRRGIVWLLQLNVGAPLFFVISGYCIASSLDSSRRKGMPPSQFLARRLWRIFPPYWASIAVIGLLVMAIDRVGLDWLHRTGVGLELASPLELNRAQWFGNFTLTETWRPLVGGSTPLLLNRVAWALCYQEQFYLICFLALIFAPKRLHAALRIATFVIVGLRVVLADFGWLPSYFGLFPDLWHEFAVGLALYWRINVAKSEVEKRAVELGLVGLVLVGWHQSMVSTVAAASFGLILIGFHRWDNAIARIRRLDGLRAIGRRSYAIYLIHLPVCTVGNAALAEAGISGFWPRALIMIPAVTIGSVLAGWAFYALIDRRFTSLPGRVGQLPATSNLGSTSRDGEASTMTLPSFGS
ncbi:acyltransferase family protein [Tundrisphaera lichenicola]|uniref:acyltransferase family protein n=1 Tax=Tundrisphaera lichenicola TaxID=2029860 RepID=UPI003EBEF6A0